MREVPEVVDVSIDRQRSVTVTYDDGVTAEFGLVDLRRACPCAACRGLREQGREPWNPSPGRDHPVIVDASLVGAWGLAVQWDDGHDTGIYAWDGLRRWHDGTGWLHADQEGEEETPA